MKKLVLIVLFVLTFGNLKLVLAAISELQITKGASFVDVTTASATPNVYGGVAGSLTGCDSSIANNEVCNNCTATIQPCNESRIYPDLKLRIEFKTDTDYSAKPNAKIGFQVGSGNVFYPEPSEASTILSAKTTLFALISWSKICAALGSSNCATDFSSQALKIGIDSAGSATTLDDVTSIQITVAGNLRVAPTFTFHSNCSDGEAKSDHEGACYFKLHKGDGKAFVEDSSFRVGYTYNQTGQTGVTYKYVRFYYEEGSITCADANFNAVNPTSSYYDLTTTSDAEASTFYLDDNKLGNLENGRGYYFRMANVDITGNVYYFSSAASDPGIAAGSSFLNCANHFIIPEEVIGLLDGKSDFSCFIATAAYGSGMVEELDVLRNFRDQFLKTNFLGRAFVKWYYEWSPKYANWLKKKSFFRAIVRGALWPLVAFAKFSLWGGITGIVLFMFGGLAVCVIGLRRFKNRV